MRQQMFRLLSMMALALIIVYMAVSALYQLYSDDPGEYTISAVQLAEALERGDAPLAQSYPLDAVYFPNDLMARLTSGEIVGLDAGSEQILFYRLTDNGVLEIGPFPQRRGESITQWRLLLISAMLVVLVLLVWPMFRDLHDLQKRAIRFSKRPFRMPTKTSRRSAIYPLAETFRRMANIVLDYCQMNQDLARTIAHEVRTPLAQIKFQLALMTAKPEHGLIVNSVNSIELLVDRYLNFARLEIQEKFIARKWINVEDFFGDLATTLESQCPNLKIGYYFPDGDACLEPDSLSIAIQNLVTNANKYADDRVNLHLEYSEDLCVFTVEDNGPGLAGDTLELTDAFTRSATDEQGYGLGLYIVKKVMMWHDGELQLDRSPKLGGTRATLRWPNSP